MTIFFHNFILLGAALLTSMLLFVCSMLNVSAHTEVDRASLNDSLVRHQQLRSMANYLEFARICDTVYVLGNRFIEVNLKTQHLTLRYRNGDSLVIPISTGNIKITDAISTPTGIFSIQNKTPEALSRQFDNTKMLWWIGFNYNVGFHGLEKDSYYRYLGVRPSSHGCVRTGREDVEKLYKLVDIGDPVMVYDTLPARILAFADTITFDTNKALRLISRTKQLGKLMNERLQMLYNGKRLAEQHFSVYIPLTQQLRPGGYQVGCRDSVVNPQAHPTTIAAGFVPSASDAFYRSAAFDHNIAILRPPSKNTVVDADSVTTNAPKIKKQKRTKKTAR
jgi:L,D-transpeptidase catalytic domain